jgi:nucleotide-binding universal stress UspA family protein
MIPRIKNILYATDLSENSAYAFRYAVNSAQKHNAKIHLLHVVEKIHPAMEARITLHMAEEKLEELKKERTIPAHPEPPPGIRQPGAER